MNPWSALIRAARESYEIIYRNKLVQEKASLYATHSQSVAEQIADRIGILSMGHLHFVGTVTNLRETVGDAALTLEDLFLRFMEHQTQLHKLPDTAASSVSTETMK